MSAGNFRVGGEIALAFKESGVQQAVSSLRNLAGEGTKIATSLKGLSGESGLEHLAAGGKQAEASLRGLVSESGQAATDLRRIADGGKQAESGLRTVTEAGKQTESELRRVGEAGEQATSKLGQLGGKLRGIGSALTGQAVGYAASFAGVTTSVVGLGKVAVSAASDLYETVNLTQVIFGKATAAVIKWGQAAAQNMGIAEATALQAAGTFGALFEQSGKTQDQAAKMGESVVQMAADWASFFNTSPEDALAALQSGLAGEIEPLRRYHVFINQTAVDQRVLKDGMAQSQDQITDQMRVLARWELIQEQSTQASGDFARTSNGLANSLRILKATLTNVAAEFGGVLLPYVLKGVRGFLSLLNAAETISPKLRTLIVVVLAAAAALGPLLVALGFMVSGLVAIGPALAALAGAFLSPIALILVAVAAFAVLVIRHFDSIRDALKPVGDVLHKLGTYFSDVFRSGNTLTHSLQNLPPSLRQLAQGVGIVVDTAHDFVRAWGDDGLMGVLRQIPAELFDLGRAFATMLGAIPGFSGISQALLGAIDAIEGKFNGFVQVLQRLQIEFWALRDSGFGTIQAAVMALSAVLPGLSGVFRALGTEAGHLATAARDVWDAFAAFAHGDISGGLRHLQAALGEVVSAVAADFKAIGRLVLTALGEIDWSAVGAVVVRGLRAALGAVGQAAGAVGNIGRSVLSSIVGAIAGADWSGIGQTITQTLARLFGAVPWGQLGRLLQTGATKALAAAGQEMTILTDIFSGALDKLGQMFPSLAGIFEPLSKAFSGLGDAAHHSMAALSAVLRGDWGTAAHEIGAEIKSFVGVSLHEWQALGTALLKVVEAIPWRRILGAIGTGLRALGAAVVRAIRGVDWANVGLTLLRGFDGALAALQHLNWQKVGEVLGKGLAQAMTIVPRLIALALNHPEVVLKAVLGLVAVVSYVLAQLTRTLVIIGGELVIGLLKGILESWPLFVNTFVSQVQGIINIFAAAATWLFNAGVALIKGLIAGIEGGIGDLWSFLGTIASGVADAFKDAGSWLVNVGGNLWSGLMGGINNGVSRLWDYLGKIGSNIIHFFSNTGDWLRVAGENLIIGFWNGIASRLAWLYDGLRSIAGKVVQVKGPPEKDRILLTPAGRLVMEGFIAGIKGMVPDLQQTLTGLTQMVAGTKFGALDAGQVRTATRQQQAAFLARPPAASGGVTRIINVNGVTIPVNGSDDPQAVADAVFRQFYGALRRLDAAGSGIAV